LVKIKLHGHLKDRYPEFEVEASSAAEAIEAWSNQTDMRHLPVCDRPIIDVIHFDTEDKLNAKLEAEELHLMPRMFGGKGSFGKILLGAALIGLSFTGIGAIALGSTTLGAGLFAAGLGLMIGGVMQMFMSTPRVDSSNDPEPSKYLGSIRNTTEIGTLIPKGYGRMKLAGQYLSVQVDAQDMVYGAFPETV
jgi:predicted phage tail protein